MDNIIKPNFSDVQLGIKKKKHVLGACMHKMVDVDIDAGQVLCRSCSKVLDPFKVLVGFALNERSLQYDREAVRLLEDEIKRLKKEEQKIKARIKYAKGKETNK